MKTTDFTAILVQALIQSALKEQQKATNVDETVKAKTAITTLLNKIVRMEMIAKFLTSKDDTEKSRILVDWYLSRQIHLQPQKPLKPESVPDTNIGVKYGKTEGSLDETGLLSLFALHLTNLRTQAVNSEGTYLSDNPDLDKVLSNFFLELMAIHVFKMGGTKEDTGEANK